MCEYWFHPSVMGHLVAIGLNIYLVYCWLCYKKGNLWSGQYYYGYHVEQVLPIHIKIRCGLILVDYKVIITPFLMQWNDISFSFAQSHPNVLVVPDVQLFSKDEMVLKYQSLTHEELERHPCVFSTVATDALVLKHQAISIHCADYIFIVLNQFPTKKFTFMVNNIWKLNNIFIEMIQLVKG